MGEFFTCFDRCRAWPILGELRSRERVTRPGSCVSDSDSELDDDDEDELDDEELDELDI